MGKKITRSFINTERLILRNFEINDKDLSALFSILSDVEVNKYLPWYPLKNIEEAVEFYKERILPIYEKHKGYYFAVCLKEDNVPIGYVTVSADESHDFGYALKKEYWNQGIGTEAAQAVIKFLKDNNYSYITATHDINNISSGRVLQKLGMTYAYSYKELWQPKNKWITFRMYQMNFDQEQTRVYKGYWNKYPTHFIEEFE